MEGEVMRDEYDFSGSEQSPYHGHVRKGRPARKPVTMNLDVRVIGYFKAEAERTGVPYQSIINAYLLQCVDEQRHLRLV